MRFIDMPYTFNLSYLNFRGGGNATVKVTREQETDVPKFQKFKKC